MSPIVAIWICSLAGALLFLAAGFLVGRTRAATSPEAVAPGAAGHMALEPTTREAALHRQVMRLETRLTETTEQRDQALRDLEAVARARPADTEAIAREALEQELTHVRQERLELSARVEALERDIAPTRGAVARQEGGDLRRLESEQAALARRRAELEQARAALERSRAEARALRGELDHARKELRTAEARSATLQMQLDERAGAAGSETAAAARDTHPTARLRSAVAGEILDGDLNSLVSRLAQGESARAAVLADSVGLTVVGHGPEVDELAAAAALLADVGARAARLLPFQRLARLLLLDETGLAATVSPFDTPRGRLALATLGAGPGPDEALVELVVEHVARQV